MLTSIILMTIPFVLILATVIYSINRVSKGLSAKTAVTRQLCSFVCIFAVSVLLAFGAAATESEATVNTETNTEASAESEEKTSGVTDDGLGYIAAALVTGIAGIGGGLAVASAAPAAIGATSEDPKAFGKALIFVALGEGIALYGLLVSILILNKI